MATAGQPAKTAAKVAPTSSAEPAQAIDPICGMTVITAGAEHRSEFAGRRYYFCCAHCRHAFEKDPGKYAEARAT
jgi:YHS domain-containing protein